MVTALHELLSTRRQLLTDRYAAELERHITFGAGLSKADVLDDFAAFINQIIFRLLRAQGLPAPEPNVENPSRTHGAQRFELGGELGSLIGEYALIRRLMIELATEAGVRLTNEEMLILGTALDDGMRAATLQFVAAKDAERRKDEIVRETFIGILGHDLQSPLNAVFAGAAMLLRYELGDAEARVTRRILSSAERMGRMIRDLLDFARGRAADGIPLERTPFDLRDVCGEVVDEMRLANPGAAPIEVTVAGETEGVWDRDRLSQAIANLLSNALAYGEPNRPVRLGIAGAGGSVAVAVTNEGERIPGPDIPKLFDPFLRGRQGLSARASKGLGLGLYITKQIVLAHGGTIHAASSAEEGTTFTFELPVR